jgi:RNA polymerase sigma factor (sigma-70 family)
MKNRNQLTPREKEIIALVAKGKSYKEMAKELAISDFTVRSHLTNIRMKLQVTRTSKVVSVAVAQGVVFS